MKLPLGLAVTHNEPLYRWAPASSAFYSACVPGTHLLSPPVPGSGGILVHILDVAAFSLLSIDSRATVHSRQARGNFLITLAETVALKAFLCSLVSLLHFKEGLSNSSCWFLTYQTNKTTGAFCNQWFSML